MGESVGGLALPALAEALPSATISATALAGEAAESWTFEGAFELSGTTLAEAGEPGNFFGATVLPAVPLSHEGLGFAVFGTQLSG